MAETKKPDVDAEAMLERVVEQRIAALLPELTEQITRQVSAAFIQAQAGGDAAGVVGQLANQLAELTRRNDGRPYISPAEQSKRDAARDKLIAYLEEMSGAIASGKAEAPVYRLTGQIQDSELGLIDHELWVDRKLVKQKIAFHGIPNEAMVPDNDTAREVHQLYMESIGGASIIGGAHHHGVLQDGQGRLYRMATRNGTVGGRDDSTPAGVSDNPTLATKAAVQAGITLVGKRAEGAVERVNILGTVHEPAKMQRL